MTRRLHEAGHEIANHSLTHRFANGLRADVMLREIDQTQQIIESVTGQRPVRRRPPWLLRTPALLDGARARGLASMSGEFCHAFDPAQPPARRIAARALAKVRPGAVLIFHDGFDARGGERAQAVRAVEIVLAELQRRGYRAVAIAELAASATR